MMLFIAVAHIPNVPALVQLIGGGLLVVLGAVIWKGRHARRQ